MVVLAVVGGKNAIVRMIFHTIQAVKIRLKDSFVSEFSREQAG